MYSPTLVQRSNMTSSLGLPRFVVTFLRHMECHKDYLKWNISEGSHKITLTLTWNFRNRSGKPSSVSENLLEKLHRTINFVRSPDSESSVPPDLSKILESAPKKHKKTPIKQRLSLTMGAIRRTLSTSSSHSSPTGRRQESFRRSSSFTLPSSQSCLYHTPANHTGSSVRLPRHNSFHTCTGGSRLLSPVRASAMTSSPTKSTYSWGAGGIAPLYRGHQSADDLDRDIDDLDGSGSPPLLDTATGSSCCSEPGVTSTVRPRIKLTYRSEDELEESLEDIMERQRKDTQAKLDDIRKEWNETIREWPQILHHESSMKTSRYRNPPPSLSSTFIAAGGLTPEQTDSEQPSSQSNIQNLQGTDVGKCLDSCEKILKRYETEIT